MLIIKLSAPLGNYGNDAPLTTYIPQDVWLKVIRHSGNLKEKIKEGRKSGNEERELKTGQKVFQRFTKVFW